jgi:hypothetical protein
MAIYTADVCLPSERENMSQCLPHYIISPVYLLHETHHMYSLHGYIRRIQTNAVGTSFT